MPEAWSLPRRWGAPGGRGPIVAVLDTGVAYRNNVKVCWQVTGIRQDAWAEKNRIVVDEEKPDGERGLFLGPALFDQPREQGLYYELSLPQQPKDERDSESEDESQG